MSLKGYQWLDDSGKVIMSFTFKYLELDIWEDTTQEELNNFKQWLKENSWDTILKINYHEHKVD